MISNIASMHFQTRKNILIALLFVNLFSALNFLCLGHLASCLIDLFGNVMILINNQYEKRDMDVPRLMVMAYIAIDVVLGVLTGNELVDLIVVAASVMYCLTIIMKSEQKIRTSWLIVLIMYLVYDVLVGAYVFALSCILSCISTMIAIIRNSKRTN
ncbi:YgjV family protein [Candidatus Saccharibacteria bacterium]|nr:YgjV family protein [Candidatus Saccharibacteria bacterium]